MARVGLYKKLKPTNAPAEDDATPQRLGPYYTERLSRSYTLYCTPSSELSKKGTADTLHNNSKTLAGKCLQDLFVTFVGHSPW